MRGRRPRPLVLADADTPILQAVARSRRLAWFQVQHARIVLAVAAGEPIRAIASRLECDRATVWRVCRRLRPGREKGKEAPPGFEPGMADLQSAALPPG